jgi:pyruvate-formate lyase
VLLGLVNIGVSANNGVMKTGTREEVNAYNRGQYALHQEQRLQDKKEYYLEARPQIRTYQQRYQQTHRAEHNAREKINYARHRRSPEGRMYLMLIQAKRRAKMRGLPFEESLRSALMEDPPMTCNCCQAALDYSTTKAANRQSPSLDRLKNAGGYTVANVRVICCRCNWLKNDATVEELETIVAYMHRG